MFSSLRHRGFRLFFIGQFVSLCGTWMQQTAQAWLVYRLTKDPWMLGSVAFAGQFPVLLLGFYAGSKVDQMDHLKLVRVTQTLAMLQAAAMALLTWTGAIQIWHVFALALLLGAVNAFDMPARQVLIGELVPVEMRHNAIALNSTIVNASRIFGPAVAGLLIAWAGETGCFALNALSFLAVIWALFRIDDVRQAHRAVAHSLWGDIREGLVYVQGHVPLRTVLLLLAVFSLAGLPIYVLLPIIADGILHSGARGMGVLSAISGLGATVGALSLARRSGARGLGGIVVQSLVFYGAALLALAYSTRFWLSGALLWLVGWSAIQVLAGANTLLQELSSDHFRGRVMSFYSMVFIGLSPVGSFLIGGLAARAGVPLTILGEGILCLAAGGLYYRRLPQVLASEGPLRPPEKPTPLPAPV